MLAAILIAALTIVFLAGVGLASAVIARHRAQSAADLAAVAAAARLPAGDAQACGQAGKLASVMGAAMRQCVVIRLDAIVVVAVAAGGWAGREATASARAGPVTGSPAG